MTIEFPSKQTWMAALAAVMVVSSGCVVAPKAFDDAARSARIQEDVERLYADQEPVTGPITIGEAMARAIKYNVDHRVKLMEQAQTRAEYKVASRDLLPRVAASAGYTSRSNEAGASSVSLLTGTQSLEPSTSQERDRGIADVTVAWNVLDFGVSYVTAKQTADRILIAEERRRRAIQNIMQDVRVAFWQAVSAQRLTEQTNTLLDDTRDALAQSQQAGEQGVQTPTVALQYQRGLLETLRALIQLRQRLSVSKTELASLINLRPGSGLELAVPGELLMPQLDMPLDELEQAALSQRPELREEDYRQRISQAEVRKAMLRMLPGIEIFAGYHADNNDFLFNNQWIDGSVSITWNLFNLFTGPAVKRQAEAQLDVDNARRLAMAMAVLTQVHVALQRYEVAKQDYGIATSLTRVSEGLSAQAQARQQASAGDALSAIRSRAEALVAQMQQDQAYAEVQNAIGRLENSIGVDPLPETVSADDIQSLTRAIAAHDARLGLGFMAAHSLAAQTPDAADDAAPLEYYGLTGIQSPAGAPGKLVTMYPVETATEFASRLSRRLHAYRLGVFDVSTQNILVGTDPVRDGAQLTPDLYTDAGWNMHGPAFPSPVHRPATRR